MDVPQVHLSIHIWSTAWLLPSLAIMTKAAINIHVQVFIWCKFLFHLGKYQGVWLLDHMIRGCLVLKETAKLFPKRLDHFVFPLAKHESSYCSTSSPALCVVSVQDFDHSMRYVVVSHCFNLQFPINIWGSKHLFMYLLAIYISSLLRCLQIFCHFLIGLLIFLKTIRTELNKLLGVLCISYKTVLYQMYLLKIFPPTLLLLFIFLTVSFTEPKFLKLIIPASQLFISWIMPLVLYLNSLSYLRLVRFSPIL